MTVRDGSTFDIDDVFAQAELLGDGKRHRRKRLIDFDALDVVELPPGPLQCLAHRRDRPEAEHAGFDSRNTVRHHTRHRFDRSERMPFRSPSTIHG
jgi:hypothetical protein